MNPRIFERFPVLTTPRLVLRELTLEDASAAFEMLRDEELHRYQSLPTLESVGAACAQIARWRKRFQWRAEIRWAITLDAALVGMCAYTQVLPGLDRGHVAFETVRRAWGSGIATEAVRAMVAFGHGEAGLHRIEAVVEPENVASQRVLRKAGFEDEGLLRAYGFWAGKHRDLRMFSIVRAP